jgi:hypothetical protein
MKKLHARLTLRRNRSTPAATSSVISVKRPQNKTWGRLRGLFFGEKSVRAIPHFTESSRALAELSLDHISDDSWKKSQSFRAVERGPSLIHLESNTGKKRRRRNVSSLRSVSATNFLRVTPQSSRVNYSHSPEEMYDCLKQDFQDYLKKLDEDGQNELQMMWRYV